MELRILQPGDEALLTGFFGAHADSSLFLRMHLHRGGLSYRGEPQQSVFAAALDDGQVVAVAAHAWNDTVMLQTAQPVPQLLFALLAHTARPVTGLLGPYAQVEEACAALGLLHAPVTAAGRDVLFALPLHALRLPDVLASGKLSCRRARDDELPLLAIWRAAYLLELGLEQRDGGLEERAQESLVLSHRDGDLFVATENDQPVAMTGFNARLPDVVQVGGVYTPPEQRGRGLSRAAVAGSLQIAREEGAQRAVLFTEELNTPAIAVYRALGFAPVGDYGLRLFAIPQRPSLRRQG